jgi:SAM-dependent methyltransferase
MIRVATRELTPCPRHPRTAPEDGLARVVVQAVLCSQDLYHVVAMDNASARMKEAIKWMWSLGDYREVALYLLPHAEALVDACAIAAGMEVLDVAAGNGNFAVLAARAGGTVTATDLTPRMIQLGRARSSDENLAVEWLEADAEELPFPDGSFDVVASVFGAMFAPHPDRVAAELFRVARPGGVVAMANYGSDGFLRAMADLLGSFSPSGPVDAPSPFLWGDADIVRDRFAGWASSIEFEERTVRFEFPTVQEGWAFWQRTNPPLIALGKMLPEDSYARVTEEGARLVRGLNSAAGARLVLDSSSLLVRAMKSEHRAQ